MAVQPALRRMEDCQVNTTWQFAVAIIEIKEEASIVENAEGANLEKECRERVLAGFDVVDYTSHWI